MRAAAPLTPLRAAVMVEEPAVIPVARPVGLTVATVALELVHDTVVDTSAVEPSLYVPVAANCWVAPMARVALPGVSAIELRVFTGAGTVRVALPLTPSKEAVTVVDPGASAAAMPDEEMVATLAFASVQAADLVTSAVEPSL